MPAFKICPHCQHKYLERSKCPNKCEDKKKKARAKDYDKNRRKRKEYYNSKEWKLLRERCIARFNNIDIYAFNKTGEVIHGKTVHHIIPIEDDPTLAKDISNLIYLTERNHREIHKEYDRSLEAKRAMQEHLRAISSEYLVL